jgi:hypothetical protein
MGFHLLSFVLGLGAAAAMPLLTRVFRPTAVQLIVAGMGAFDEVRRVVVEQMEAMEDIAAEARAKREEILAEATMAPSNGSEAEAAGGRPPRRLRRQRTS